VHVLWNVERTGIAVTLDDIRRGAELAASEVELNWEELNAPTTAKYFTDMLDRGVRMIPALESLYTSLLAGTSVFDPDAPTELQTADVEQYKEIVAEELYAAYLIREVRDTFDRVNNIIQLSQEPSRRLI